MEPQEEHNEAEKGKRNMEKLFDLQVFAQENTQTTGGLSAEMKTYYGMELLDNAKPQLVHNQFAATKPLPTGGGKTVEWRKFGSFDKALTPLTEGVTPDGSGISVSYITKELAQYGDYTTVSDMLDLTAIDDVVLEITDRHGANMGLTLDTVTRNEIQQGKQVLYLASGGTAVGVGKYAEHDRAVEVNPEWEVYVKGKPLWELIYPVGSLYLSAVDTDPGVLFGGTWERIRDRFLLAAGTAYGAGTTGGEAVHTLAENELPIHAHDPANQAGYYGFITNSQKAFTVGDMGVQSGSGRYYPYAPAAFDISRNTKTGSVGGGKAHNNMPPYLAVYVWQRTA